MRKIIGKKNKVHYVEETTRFQMVKSHKGWLVIGASMFALGLGMLVTSRPVSADVAATSTSSSAINAETTSASSSSATNAETTGASSSSATNAETTGASSSSAVNADSTGASSGSAVNADSTSANNSSAVNAETTSASSSSATNAETTGASSSTVKADVTSAGSVTNTGFSVSDPDYPSGMWIDPDNSHYSYEWLQAKDGGNQIVFSTNRTGDGIVYVTELSESNKVLKQYTLNQNTKVTSDVFDSTIYYNDVYFEMVRSSSNSFVTKYTASKFDNNYYSTLSYFVPKLIKQTTY